MSSSGMWVRVEWGESELLGAERGLDYCVELKTHYAGISQKCGWTYIETVIQSDASQKEKNKYHILSIYVQPRKMVQVNLFEKEK